MKLKRHQRLYVDAAVLLLIAAGFIPRSLAGDAVAIWIFIALLIAGFAFGIWGFRVEARR